MTINNNITFRSATINDLSQLLALEQQVVAAERPFNTDIKAQNAKYYDLPAMIDSENVCLLVAEKEGDDGKLTIIATGYGRIEDSKVCLIHQQHVYLGFMLVVPEYRGQGLNQQIMEKLIKWGKSLGQTHFYLDVYAQNESAIRAYQKAGFEASLVEMKLSVD